MIWRISFKRNCICICRCSLSASALASASSTFCNAKLLCCSLSKDVDEDVPGSRFQQKQIEGPRFRRDFSVDNTVYSFQFRKFAWIDAGGWAGNAYARIRQGKVYHGEEETDINIDRRSCLAHGVLSNIHDGKSKKSSVCHPIFAFAHARSCLAVDYAYSNNFKSNGSNRIGVANAHSYNFKSNRSNRICVNLPTVASTPSGSFHSSPPEIVSRRVKRFASSAFQHKPIDYETLVKENVDCLVIGAGVVGLAVARQLAMHGRSVLVVEAEATIGSGTSSRNSEVIHAGIYYPPGSLKATLCVEGKKLLYQFCRENGIPHKQIGKLIVATSEEQVSVLEKLQKTGWRNGVEDLRILQGEEAMGMEPQLNCMNALLSPSTGIIDSYGYMLALQANAEDLGVTFAFNTMAIGGRLTKDGIDVVVQNTEFSSDDSSMEEGSQLVLSPQIVVNSAGLHAQALVRRLHGFSMEFIPKGYFAKGSYFSPSGIGRNTFSHLVYPVPEEGGLGVHLTLDLAGRIKFGPDVEWLGADTNLSTQFDYTVDESRAGVFYSAIRTYYPSLPDGCLAPDYSGIRPKLSGPGEKARDFMIQGEDCHGVPGLVNLFGIESPGLTASLPIAQYVCSIISKR